MAGDWKIGTSPSLAAWLESSVPLLIDEVTNRLSVPTQIIATRGQAWRNGAIAGALSNRNVHMHVTANRRWMREYCTALLYAQECGVADRALDSSDCLRAPLPPSPGAVLPHQNDSQCRLASGGLRIPKLRTRGLGLSGAPLARVFFARMAGR
jgi:hypothetical protein